MMAIRGFMYILMGILICEAGREDNNRAGLSATGEVMVVTFLLPEQADNMIRNATTVSNPGIRFIVVLLHFFGLKYPIFVTEKEEIVPNY